MAVARALLLFAFAASIFTLVRSGEIRLYIHPRFAPYTLAAAAALVLMAVVQLGRALRARRTGSAASPIPYLLFLVPLVLGLGLPPAQFGADLAAKQGVNLTARGRAGGPVAAVGAAPDAAPAPAGYTPPIATLPAAPAVAAPAVAVPAVAAPAVAAPAVAAPAVAAPPATAPPAPAPSATAPSGPNPAGGPPAEASTVTGSPGNAPADVGSPAATPTSGPLIVDDDSYASRLLAVYADPQAHMGQAVQLTGFVFRPEGVGPDEFVLARLIVTCHVAHAVPDGFLVYWPAGDQLKEDSWYSLEGVFTTGQYRGKEIIQIKAQRLTPVAKPANPYIYG